MESKDNNIDYIYKRYLKINKDYEDDIKKETEINLHDVFNQDYEYCSNLYGVSCRIWSCNNNLIFL